MGVMNSAKRTKISIVIPALNEGEEIKDCLESLTRQDFPNFEVIVVDNGSIDDTIRIARRYGCRVILEERKGVSYARQRGFEAARGKIIASTDADTVVPPDWLSLIADSFAGNSHQVGVYGRVLLRDKDGFSHSLAEFLFTLFLRLNHLLNRPHFCGPNFAVRKSMFEEVLGFQNEDHFYAAAEDFQLSLKMAEKGKVRFLKDLVVYTSSRKLNRSSWKYLWTHTKDYWAIAWLGKTR